MCVCVCAAPLGSSHSWVCCGLEALIILKVLTTSIKSLCRTDPPSLTLAAAASDWRNSQSDERMVTYGWMDGWRDRWVEGWRDRYLLETAFLSLLLFVWSPWCFLHPAVICSQRKAAHWRRTQSTSCLSWSYVAVSQWDTRPAQQYTGSYTEPSFRTFFHSSYRLWPLDLQL